MPSETVKYVKVREGDRTPEQVRLAEQLVGELLWLSVRTRPDYVLRYAPCGSGGPGEESLMGLTVLSDASRAPGGGRGCQARDNPARGEGPTFAAFEQYGVGACRLRGLYGYYMGEGFGSIADAIEDNKLAMEGTYRLKGDNLSGLQLLAAPDGPWRTRCLRLRSFVEGADCLEGPDCRTCSWSSTVRLALERAKLEGASR